MAVVCWLKFSKPIKENNDKIKFYKKNQKIHTFLKIKRLPKKINQFDNYIRKLIFYFQILGGKNEKT